jgi:hypothetical protein
MRIDGRGEGMIIGAMVLIRRHSKGKLVALSIPNFQGDVSVESISGKDLKSASGTSSDTGANSACAGDFVTPEYGLGSPEGQSHRIIIESFRSQNLIEKTRPPRYQSQG